MRGLDAINARCISPLSASCLGLQLREIEYSSEAHQNWFRNFICQVFENSNRAVVPIPKVIFKMAKMKWSFKYSSLIHRQNEEWNANRNPVGSICVRECGWVGGSGLGGSSSVDMNSKQDFMNIVVCYPTRVVLRRLQHLHSQNNTACVVIFGLKWQLWLKSEFSVSISAIAFIDWCQ